MVKNVIIGFLIILLCTVALVSFIKASEAEKALVLAVEQKTIAEKMKLESERLSLLATERAAEAQMQKNQADSLLEKLTKCQGK